MRTGFRALAFGALLSLGFGSCACGEDPPEAFARPDPVFSPETLAFEGLCAGVSRRQEFRVANKGRGRLDARVSFEGEGAESYRLEADGEPVEAFAVEPSGERTFEVVFEPRAPAGDKEAWLVLEWGKDERREILLTGYLSANPDAPAATVGWELCESEKNDCAHQEAKEKGIVNPCCLPPRTVHFGKVGLEQTATVNLKVENRGCSAATITAVNVLPDEDDCEERDLVVDIAEEGVEVPGTPDVAVATIALHFTPTRACALSRQIEVLTSDPEKPSLVFSVVGEGVKGNLELVPPLVSPVHFGSVRKNEFAEKSLELWNAGDDAAVLTEVSVVGDHREHFQITGITQCGREVSLPFTVRSWTEVCPSEDPTACEGKPPLCESRVSVEMRYAPKGPGRHGPTEARLLFTQDNDLTSVVQLMGLSMPVFRAYPSQLIAFGAPDRTGCGVTHDCSDCINGFNACAVDADCAFGARCVGGICTDQGLEAGNEYRQAMCATSCGEAVRSFLICNENGYNDLELRSLRIVGQQGKDAPIDPKSGEPIFTLDAADCENRTLEPDACCQGTIALRDSWGGGEINAVLELASNVQNDVHRIDIKKNTATIEPPVVESFSVTPSLPRVGNAVRVKANVTARYGGVSLYRWFLKAPASTSDLWLEDWEFEIDPANPDRGCGKPGGTGCFQLLDDQGNACLPDGSNCTTLVFFPDIGGPETRWTYTLEVHGDVCADMWSFKSESVVVTQ